MTPIVFVSEAEGRGLLGEPEPRRPKDPKERIEEMIRALGLDDPEREFRFARAAKIPRRREGRVGFVKRAWRFDWAWPGPRIALEFEGGVFTAEPGRHTMPAGYEADCEKYSYAALLGWVVLRVTPAMTRDGRAEDLLRFAFGKGWKEPTS